MVMADTQRRVLTRPKVLANQYPPQVNVMHA
jgi:hypothetical protein